MAALLVVLPTLLTAAPTSSQPHPSPLQKRAIQYIEESDPNIELTFETLDSYFLQALPLNTCVGGADLKIPSQSVYSAMGASEPEMAINFYLDDKCQEYDFSIQSGVPEYAGSFASAKYIGMFSGVKPGVYDKKELSKTAFPEGEPMAAPIISVAPDSLSSNNNPTTGPSGQNNGGMLSAGFAVGMGIVGFLAMAGIVGLGAFFYHKNGGTFGGVLDGKKRGGDGRAFMTLASGRDDYDDEVGLTGENGPHSSALMQSRVSGSFDDERYPATYRDEDMQ
ncbi:hypothetical protein EDD11_003296 [Mortierella claussenii]|nr:hypothetical protein EDD11_003296 [Mortierella claussenii]